jgi:hypothetical protein
MREALVKMSTGIEISVRDLLESITVENFDIINTEIENYEYDFYVVEQILEELDKMKKNERYIYKLRENILNTVLTIFQKPILEEDVLRMDYTMKLFSFEENNLSQDFFKESYNAVELLNLKNFKVKLFLTLIHSY